MKVRNSLRSLKNRHRDQSVSCQTRPAQKPVPEIDNA